MSEPQCKLALLDGLGGEDVFMRDRPVGVVTATGYGHTAGRNLTWAYVDPGYDIPGTVPRVHGAGHVYLGEGPGRPGVDSGRGLAAPMRSRCRYSSDLPSASLISWPLSRGPILDSTGRCSPIGVNVIPGPRRLVSLAHADELFEAATPALDRACRELGAIDEQAAGPATGGDR